MVFFFLEFELGAVKGFGFGRGMVRGDMLDGGCVCSGG